MSADYIINPYICALLAEGWSEEIFISIISKTPKISIGFGGNGAAQPVVRRLADIQILIFTNQIPKIAGLNERLNLLFHEAIVRSDRPFMDAFVTQRIQGAFSVASFERYLQLRNRFTPSDAEATKLGLEFLLSTSVISDAMCLELLKVMSKYAKFEMSISVLPAEIRSHVEKPSNRNLLQLYCEFLSQINPSFPAYHVDSEVGQHLECNISKDELRRFQDVTTLRQTLAKLDTSTLLAKFCKAANDLKEDKNPAAVLLAEILLYHANDKIVVDGKEEKFLSVELVQTGVILLNRLYKLSPTEQLYLAAIRDMQTVQEEQGEKLQETKQEVIELRWELKETQSLLKELLSELRQKRTQEAEDQKPKRAHNGLGLM